MAVPSLKLDLAPPSNLWRLNHAVLGWAALFTGALLLALSLGFSLRAYRQAALAGQAAVLTKAKTRMSEDAQQRVMDELRSVDVTKELPRWRLAERIFTERGLPWSRLTAELERSMVQDVRIKSLQRTRGSDMKVQVKVKGEARTREAEASFVESLQKNTFFEQVILEREGERQGGGVDFEYTLAALSVPPPYTPLPKFGPKPKAVKQPAVQPPPKAANPVGPRPVQPAAVRPGTRPMSPSIPPAAPQPQARPQAQPQPQPAAVPPMGNQPPVMPRFVPGQPNPNARPRPARPRPSNPGGDE